MSVSTLINELKLNGYQVNHFDEAVRDIGSISVFTAKKGKFFSKKIIIFTVESFENKNFYELIEFIKTNNWKNDLCVVLCNTENISDSKTMYMVDNGDGVCIIHFVYFNNKSKSYIWFRF